MQISYRPKICTIFFLPKLYFNINGVASYRDWALHSKPWGKVKIIRANHSWVVNNPKASCFGKKLQQKGTQQAEGSSARLQPRNLFYITDESTDTNSQQTQHMLKLKKKKKLFCSRPNHGYISVHLIILLIEYACTQQAVPNLPTQIWFQISPSVAGVATASSQTAILTEIKVGTGPQRGCLFRQSRNILWLIFVVHGRSLLEAFSRRSSYSWCTRKETTASNNRPLWTSAVLWLVPRTGFWSSDLRRVGSEGTFEEIISV